MSSKPAAGPSGTAGPDGPKPNGAAAMANRPAISKLSMHIWQMVKQAKNKTMSEAQILAGVNQSGKPKLTVAEVGPAIVDLMKKKLLGSSKSPDGTRQFHWQSREGASSLEANTPEMNMCWSFISQAGNKGTTAKAIRMKIGPDRITPTAVRRALDALVRAQQIKIFKSIQHPTMQLYVLADTTPDEGMTGGIWYDGNKEYDSAFVTGITKVLLTHVRTKSWATNDKRPEAKKLVSNPIYAPGKGPALPSPRDLLKYCQDTRVVNAPLTLKNVMECMRALELDGLVEVIKPAYHVAGGSDDDEYLPPPSKRAKTDVDSDEEERKAEQRREKQKEKLRRKAEAKKAKEKEKRKKEKEKAKRKKEKKRRERAERKAAKKKKEKEKRKKSRDDSESDIDMGSDDELRALSDIEDEGTKSKSKSAKKRKRSDTVSSSSASSSDTDSDSDSDSDSSSDSDSDSDSSASSIDSDDIDNHAFDADDYDIGGDAEEEEKDDPGAKVLSLLGVHSAAFGSTDLTRLDDPHVVYRAINRYRYPLSQDQVSCGKCPQFEFCEEKGPVNPDNCVYLEDWLADHHGGWDAEGKQRFKPELVAQQKQANGANGTVNGAHPDIENAANGHDDALDDDGLDEDDA